VTALRRMGGHPNVVQLLGVYRSPDTAPPFVAMAMALCACDLFELVARGGPLPEGESRLMFSELVRVCVCGVCVRVAPAAADSLPPSPRRAPSTAATTGASRTGTSSRTTSCSRPTRA